jgi:hypothetical protein
MDTVRENRTGISRYNQGLDADSLNHTATGITRIMDAAEMRVKLIARIFAETLIVDMFRGIHETLQMYGEEQCEFELRGEWHTVSPREWKRRKQMKVTLPMGGASKQQLIQFFQGLLTTQQNIVQAQGGPNGPLVKPENVFNVLQEMCKLAGLDSANPFFSRPDPNAPPPPPPPDPKMVEAQAKVQAEHAKQQADQQLQQQRLQFEMVMEKLKLQAQHEREATSFQHKQQLDRMKFEHDAAMEQLRATFEMKIEKFREEQRAQSETKKADAQAEAIRKQPAKGSASND